MTSGWFIHPSVRPFFYLHAIYQGIEVAEERRQFLATRRLPNSVFSGEHSMNCHEDFAQAKSLEDPRACPQSVRGGAVVFPLTGAMTPFPRAMRMPVDKQNEGQSDSVLCKMTPAMQMFDLCD